MEARRRYEEFLKRLAKLNLGQIVRCEEREGFGFALKNALRHVRTPYVLVVQHDRNFVRPADVEAVVRCLEANAETVKYVMLPTTTCLHYARLVLSKYRRPCRMLPSRSTRRLGISTS